MAARIAQLRREKSAAERRDVLQAEIAKAAGLSVVTYGRYENGQRKVPDEVVIALADYFGTTPWFIRYGVEAAAGGSPTSGTLTQAELDQFRKERDASRWEGFYCCTFCQWFASRILSHRLPSRVDHRAPPVRFVFGARQYSTGA
jgi:transcriptional regulator with XRE-family HTH domain